MAKNKLSWSEEKYKRLIREGRGQGIGKEYKPWLTIHDFPSLGRVSRIFGWKTGRIHHLFSDLQTRYFYMLEWEDTVIDIREHFPLLDIEDTIKDRDDLRFEIFTDKDSGVPYVINTNFLITLKNTNGSISYLARTVKMASDLEKKKTLERLEIERRYWIAKGIDWGIVTQKEISNVFAKNIEWVHPSLYSYQERGFSKEEIIYMGGVLIERLEDSTHSIRKITADFDKEFNYESGTGLFVFKFLVASKQIYIDMTKPIDINVANPDIGIKQQERKEGATIIC
ncbi:MAG: TnsA endonuclease N-terminal domain-containing protein, partial [Eubacteriales bacterium]|nr:TnsA endonuclease N-terminal domain-containing protein [Eubacteriales bacterium]